LTDFLIDTLGNEYKLETDIEKLDSTIMVLDLRNQHLDTIQPSVFRQKQLKVLLVNGNRIKNLPNGIGNLTNLQKLDLSFNQLTSLPIELSNLKNLQTLNLANNLLTILPNELGKLTNLQNLYLYDNKLMNIPIEFSNLKNMQTLALPHYRLYQIQYYQHAEYLKVAFGQEYRAIASRLLRIGKFSEAEQNIRHSMTLDSTNFYLMRDLPLALLMQGKYEVAEKEYLRLKDRTFGKSSLPLSLYKDAFLADFKEFEENGIIPKDRQADVEKIKALLKK
jgi:hypothetical protein